MRTSLVTLVAVTALLSPSLSTGDAALTCPYRFQSRVGSTLSNPPVASLSSSSGLADADGSGSGRSDDEVGTKKPSMSGSDASSGSGMKEVGSSDKGDSDAGSDAGDDAGAGTTMTPPPASTSPSPPPSTTPPATTEAPATTTEAPTSAPTPTTASTSPEATTDAPTSTPSATPTTVTEAPTSTPSTRPTATTEAPTETPTTETPAASPTPPTVSASATPDVTTAAPTATPSAGSTVGLVNTTRLAAVRRSLQRTNTTTTTLAPAVTTSPVAANNTTNGSVGNTTSVPSTTARTVVPAVASNGTAASNSTASSGSGNTTTTIVDSFTCDETFYEQWETLGITCGGVNIDVSAAVAAASCVIYSGALGSIAGSTCVSICAFPACVNKKWQYGASNGIASDVYKNVGIASFLPSDVAAGVSSRLTGAPVMVGNTTFKSTQQCSYTSEDSFSPCSCSALSATTNVTDAQIKRQREADVVNGVISMDDTSSAGSVLAPTTQTVAGVTVIVSAVAVITSSTVGGVSVASASVSALGANVGVWTIEICQFGVMINQMKLEGKSAALSLFGKQLAPAAFTFLPFGKLDSNEPSTLSKGRRLTEDAAGSHRGIAQYSRTLGIREDMLFLVTLAGVVVVMAGVLMLFGVAYGLAGLFMAREDFMAQFFDKMIGLLVLAAILSQYTIGVTATYQIYYSSNLDELSDPKCVLAILSLIVLALGIMLYGYIVIKRHEDDLRDVGTHTHINKKVCQRYGPFYDEYKFKNRYFFAAKMMLALVTGVATGYAGLQARYQVTFALAAYAIYFLYLEVQSPHHSKFVQTTTSFVTIMKIAVLALTFFLIDSTTASYMPSELQNGISLAIVGLNLFVLFLLMVRALYSLWKKYRLQKDAHYDEDEDQTVASDCAKDESETGKPGDSKPSQSPTHQISNLQETPIGGLGYFETPVQRSSVGNPRQPYTASTREPYAPSPQVSRPNHTPGNRRNDVIEL